MKNFSIASVGIVVLLILGACNKSSQLNAGFFAVDQPNLVFTDSLVTVNAQTENPDSIFALNVSAAGTSAFSQLPWGRMYDNVFGVSDARIFANFGALTTLALDSTLTYTLDSVKMVLIYNGADTYGDTTDVQKMGFYRLDASESFTGSSLNFYTNKKFKSEATPLASISFTPFPNTYVRRDTDYFKPHIQFRLPDDFGRSLLNPSIYSIYGPYGGDIRQFFRGFEFRSEKTTNAMLSFSVAEAVKDSSGIYLYYRKLNDTTQLKYRFAFSNLRYPYFNQNYAAGSINKLYAGKKTISGDSLLFVQGMSGPNIKIEFPDLKKQLASFSPAINRAELEFTVVEDSTDKYTPVDRFILTTASGALIADLNRNNAAAVTDFGGVAITEAGNLRRYRCNISQQLQYMLNGTSGTIMYLWPDNRRANIPNKQGTTRRTVLYGTKSSKNRAKLNIYYTKP